MIFLTKGIFKNKRYNSIQEVKENDKSKIFIEIEYDEYEEMKRKIEEYEKFKIDQEDEKNKNEKIISNLKEAVCRWKNKAEGKPKIREFEEEISIVKEEYNYITGEVEITFSTIYPKNMPHEKIEEIVLAFEGKEILRYKLCHVNSIYKIKSTNVWNFKCIVETIS